jgi:signal transduction histidine kinase
LRRDVTLGAGLLIALLASLLGLAGWRDYAQELAAGQDRAQTLSELLAAQTEATTLSLDRTLRGISRTVQFNGTNGAAHAMLTRLVTQEARELPMVRAVLVAAADGTLAADSESDPPRVLNLAAHSYFIRHRDLPVDEMSVDVEAGDGQGGSPSIIFSRRLVGGDGAFAGVAAALVDPTYFVSLYRGVAHSVSPDIMLLHDDGTLLAHYPIERLANAARGDAPRSVPSDGPERLIGFARLGRLPLALSVGLDRQRVLAHWRDEAIFVGSIGALGLSSMIAVLVILRRYLAQQEEERRLLRERDETLGTANEHLRAALDHANHGTLLYDHDHRLVLCNRRYLELMNLRDDALRPGMTLDEMAEALRQNGSYSAVELAEMTTHRRAALASGDSQDFFEHLADGTILQVRADPVREGGLLLTLTDITASVASAAALRAAKEEAERASEAKTDFIAHVSHDLRTPLTAIIGFADALSGGYFGPLPPKQKEYIDTIGLSAQHLLALINNLLDVAKIEAGRYELEEEEIDLGDMIDRLVRLVQLRADQQGITIENRVAEIWVAADSNALQQMLLNLLSNAVKFTPGSGAIKIEANPAPEGALDVTVRDSGVGIPSDFHDQVLLPYFRVSGSRVEGTGLGLPLVKALIELHGGQLLLASEPGQGTAVTLRFPASRVLSSTAPPLQS